MGAMASTDRKDIELTLMALVARKHYLGNLSKSEIADQLYLSRFKVARLLEAAKEQGIVTFTVGLPGNVNLNLSRELRDAFGLEHAVVIDDLEDESTALMLRLGDATAMLLSDLVNEGDLVGIASTRTLMGLREATSPIARCSFVQLTGGLPRSDASDVIGGIRSLTELANGTAHVFYAPMVAASEEAARSHRTQPEVIAAFDLMPHLDVIVTGIGAWQPGRSLIHDALPEDISEEAAAAGAVCEAVGVPIDAAGHTVDCVARRRIIAPDVEVLQSARHRIGVVFDPDRAAGVRIALAAKLVNCLVTHRADAEALLQL